MEQVHGCMVHQLTGGHWQHCGAAICLWAIMADLVHVSGIASRDTRRSFLRWLVWSLIQCWTGKVATHDPNGRPCANAGTDLFGGFAFVVWISAQDLDWVYKD